MINQCSKDFNDMKNFNDITSLTKKIYQANTRKHLAVTVTNILYCAKTQLIHKRMFKAVDNYYRSHLYLSLTLVNGAAFARFFFLQNVIPKKTVTVLYIM